MPNIQRTISPFSGTIGVRLMRESRNDIESHAAFTAARGVEKASSGDWSLAADYFEVAFAAYSYLVLALSPMLDDRERCEEALSAVRESLALCRKQLDGR